MSHQQQSTEDQRMDVHSSPPVDELVLRRADMKPGAVLRGGPPADESARIAAALRAARRLTLPPAPPVSAASEGDDEVQRAAIAAEEDALRLALRVLADLALPVAAAVFVAEEGGAWRALPVAEPSGDPRAPELEWPRWPDFAAGDAVVASPERDAEIWASLAPWLEQAAPENVAGRVALVPVLVGRELRAVCALGVAGPAPIGEEERWLPVAAAVAASAAAGIRALRLELRAQEEGRARDAYISLAAHELRSPLTSIKGYAQLLLRQARKNPIPDTMRRSIESIEQQSMRMAEMVGEMLDASRIRRGALDLMLAPTDLVPLAQKVVERRAAFYPQHTITVESGEPSLAGDWDAARIEQILRDLVDNAARHSPGGGEVAVRMWREDGRAIVSVRDRGIGVAEADRERIFEYLYRASASEQRNLSGLGLGLFVCRHLAERMGGRLVLYASSTEQPGGSEFRLTLPLAS